MNVPFAAWLHRCPEVWIVFHEVAFPWGKDRPISHRTLAVTTHVMAWIAARSASRVFVTIPHWEATLRALGIRGYIEWLPVPSNLPTEVDAERVDAARRRMGNPARLVGHFGTYQEPIASVLEQTLARLAEKEPHCSFLCLGRDGDAFARRLGIRSVLRGRIHGPGGLGAAETAALLKACDLVVQPYRDGLSTRRGSLMAGLGLGCPVLSNLGHLTEPFWQSTDAVALSTPPDAMASHASELLHDEGRRSELGENARRLYYAQFSITRLVDRLVEGHSSTTSMESPYGSTASHEHTHASTSGEAMR